MDLGQIQVENGCFVEEEGSTYCFCDFNRCNAAGILDLRNLIDTNRLQSTTTRWPFTTTTTKNQSGLASDEINKSSERRLKLLDKLEIERDGYIELNRYPINSDDQEMSMSLAKSQPLLVVGTTTTTKTTATKTTTTSSKPHTILPTSAYLSTMDVTIPNVTTTTITTTTLSNRTTTAFASTSSARNNLTTSFSPVVVNMSTSFPFKTSYSPALNNLDQLLIDYLNFSKTVNSHLITETIRQQIIKRSI